MHSRIILKDALGISYDQFTFPHNVNLSGKLYGAESLDDFAGVQMQI